MSSAKKPISKQRITLENFVNRTEILEELNNWARESREGNKRVVLLEGMGGIGKSVLLEKWIEGLGESELPVALVKCDDFLTDLLGKAEQIAKDLKRHDIKTPRFDVIRIIHRRVMNDYEPADIVDSKSPLWDFAAMLPVVGQIGGALSIARDISFKVKGYLEKRRGRIAIWFREWFESKDYHEELLRVITQESVVEDFLILDALQADIDEAESNAIIILDVFETVFDHSNDQRRTGKVVLVDNLQFAEEDLWLQFLSQSSVLGVISGQRVPDVKRSTGLFGNHVEYRRVEPLNKAWSAELMQRYQIPESMHQGMADVSGGHPQIISMLCYAYISDSSSKEEILSMQGGTIEKVREDALTILFRHLPKSIETLARIAAMAPFFDVEILMEATSKHPEFASKGLFNQFMKLNIIENREAGWSLHECVRTPILADLTESFLQEWCPRLSEVMKTRFKKTRQFEYLAAAIMITSLLDETKAFVSLVKIVEELDRRYSYGDIVSLLSSSVIQFKSQNATALLDRLHSRVLMSVEQFERAEVYARQAIGHASEFLSAYYGVSATDFEEGLVHVSAELVERIKSNSKPISEFYRCNLALVEVLYYRKKNDEAVELTEKQLASLKKLKQIIATEEELYYSFLRFRGWLHISQNEHTEAEAVFQEMVQIRRSQIDSDSSQGKSKLGTALHDHGIILRTLGKLEECEVIYQEILEIRKEAGMAPSTANIHSSYGILLIAMLRWEEAVEHFKECLRIRKTLAEKHPNAFLPGVASVYNSLATLLRDQGYYEEARTYFDEALKILRGLSEKLPITYDEQYAGLLNGYAALLRRLGQNEDAEEYLRESIRVRRELAEEYGIDNSIPLCFSFTTLAVLLRNTGRFDEALELYEEAGDINRALAEKSPQVYLGSLAYHLNEVGILLRKMRRYDEAQENFEEALRIYQNLVEKVSESHRDSVGFTLTNLGVLLEKVRNYESAEETFLEAVDIYRELVSESRDGSQQQLAFVLSSLGSLLKRMRRYEDAEFTFWEALELYERLYENAPEGYARHLAYTLNHLGILLRNGYRYDEAEPLLRRAISIYQEIASTQPKRFLHKLAQSIEALASLLASLDAHQESQENLEEALRIYRELAATNPHRIVSSIASTLLKLARIKKDQGNLDDAEKHLLEALEINIAQMKINPRTTPRVISVLKELGYILRKIGRIDEAEEYEERARELSR